MGKRFSVEQLLAKEIKRNDELRAMHWYSLGFILSMMVLLAGTHFFLTDGISYFNFMIFILGFMFTMFTMQGYWKHQEEINAIHAWYCKTKFAYNKRKNENLRTK